MRRACVIGWPANHSLSPVIHGYWLKFYGLSGSYEIAPVTPGDFVTYVNALHSNGFTGANVTLPHKIAAHALCEKRDAAASAIGAVNTLWFEHGRLCGSNTDAFGFIANLDKGAPGWDVAGNAAVIGAGGASRAIVWALRQRGFGDIRIVNRSLDRAQEIAHEFGAVAYAFDRVAEALRNAALIVNASSLGMSGQPPLDVDLSQAAPAAVACDIVYRPLETPFLHHARTLGLTPVDGLGMLLHQAAQGFERWFGVTPAVSQELRMHVLETIARRETGHL